MTITARSDKHENGEVVLSLWLDERRCLAAATLDDTGRYLRSASRTKFVADQIAAAINALRLEP